MIIFAIESIGLKISYEKTNVYRIGSLSKSNAQLYTSQNLKWTNDHMYMLGVYLSCDGEYVSRNYEEILKKIDTVTTNWYNKTSTLMGKVLIVNSLIGSLFVYKMSVMITLSDAQIKAIEKKITAFLWNGRRARISLVTLQKDKTQGGLRLVDLRAKQNTVMIKWIFSIEKDPFLKNSMYNAIDQDLQEVIWEANLERKHVYPLLGFNQWTQILYAWCSLNHFVPTSNEEVMNQLLWYNSCILINRKPVKWRKWIKKGILYVKDICLDGKLCTHEEICNTWGAVSWLEFQSIKTAIPMEWKEMLQPIDNAEITDVKLYRRLKSTPISMVSRKIYNMFIFDEVYVHKYAMRWESCNIKVDFEDYLRCFQYNFIHTKITKFRDFQYRMLLCKIVCNEDLYNWGKVDTPLCTLCGESNESVCHLFVECKITKKLLVWFRDTCLSKNIEVRVENHVNILFNLIGLPPANICHFILIYIKQYVYRSRCAKKKSTVVQLEREIEYIQQLEWNGCCGRLEQSKHIKRWSPWYPNLAT